MGDRTGGTGDCLALDRRALLAGLVGIGGCAGRPLRPEVSPTPTVVGEPVSRTEVDLTGDGLADVRLANGDVYVQMNSERLASTAGAVAGGRVGGSNVVGAIATRPKTPTSRTESASPAHNATAEFGLVADGDPRGGYRLVRDYHLAGTPFRIAWRISVRAGVPAILARVRYTNLGSEPLELDQDAGDIHDGIGVFRSIGLVGREAESAGYRFAIGGGRSHTFADVPVWKTFPSGHRATVFDDEVGVTYGLLSASTASKMWIVVGGGGLDWQMNETVLGAAESLSYGAMIAVHDGGSEAPTIGRERYERVQSRLSG